jgi:hypothetical protein
MCVLAVFGVVGALKLPMFNAAGNIYEGVAPLVYSLALFVSGVVLFFMDKTGEKFSIRSWLVQGAKNKAFVFFMLNVLLVIMVYMFGVLIAMLVYSFLSCLALKRQTRMGIILFSVFYVAAVYFVFIVALKMPFDSGIIIDLVLG